MNIYYFYHQTEQGYEKRCIAANDSNDAYFSAEKLGYNSVTGFYLNECEADESLYCKIHDC